MAEAQVKVKFVGYKAREVSSEEIYNLFDPPFIFRVRFRAEAEWYRFIQSVDESEELSLSDATTLMAGIALSVSNGEERISLNDEAGVREFVDKFIEAEPEIGEELFIELSYALALEFIEHQRSRLAELKKTTKR